MQINCISVYAQTNSINKRNNVRKQEFQQSYLMKQKTEASPLNNVKFKGLKVGGYLGILTGAAAAVALSVACAPALICAGSLLGLFGMTAGEKLQEKITGEQSDILD